MFKVFFKYFSMKLSKIIAIVVKEPKVLYGLLFTGLQLAYRLKHVVQLQELHNRCNHVKCKPALST